MFRSLNFWAGIAGVIFILVGIAGFMPQFTTPDGMLLGLFMVDTLHNTVHIVSGVIALLAATNYRYSRLFFQIFGIVYLAIAIIGFARNGDLFIMQVNMADNLLHLGIAIVALFFGFVFR